LRARDWQLKASGIRKIMGADIVAFEKEYDNDDENVHHACELELKSFVDFSPSPSGSNSPSGSHSICPP
jgi:hypothetical protein